ncbi:ROK family transcriptional regulator [Streptomyces amakusaensis]|uniref:ROK family transcriptional regulator n=1 Tax=Streptomyces amakusaensis TaxID=67271 RepID=A0ABW0AGA0_9ACTN
MQTPGSQTSLHRANLERVVRAVRMAGSPTQAEIARSTGLSAATVSNIVRELKESGAVEVTPTSVGGRRARSISLSGDAGVVVGVDFGHTRLRVAVADLAHRVLAEESEPLDADSRAEEGLDRAAELIGRLVARAGAGPDKVIGVGLGVPGPVDTDSGVLGATSMLPRWVGASPGREMSDRLGVPVLVDNDANLAALGELVWGGGRGIADLAYIKVAEGVGAGLVIGGRIFRGPGGTAGEIGHITLDESGPVCRCGNRGCVETFAAARHVLPLLGTAHGPGLTMERVVALAHEGDLGCRRVVADVGRHLGSAVAGLCNLLNPSRVLIGGYLAEAGELALGPVRDSVARYAIPSAARRLTVAAGSLGERAEVLGAVALVLSEMGDSPLIAGVGAVGSGAAGGAGGAGGAGAVGAGAVGGPVREPVVSF